MNVSICECACVVLRCVYVRCVDAEAVCRCVRDDVCAGCVHMLDVELGRLVAIFCNEKIFSCVVRSIDLLRNSNLDCLPHEAVAGLVRAGEV